MPSRNSSVGSASALVTPAAARLGPRPRTTIWSLPLVIAQSEAGDDDVVTGADKGPRADVGQLRQDGLAEIVNFNQGDTRGVVLAPDNGGVGSGIQGGIDGGFEIIGGRDAGGKDRGLLRGIVSPVVVDDRDKSARTVQFQHRISQRIGHTGLVKEGPMARRSTCFGAVPVMMKPPMPTLSPV